VSNTTINRPTSALAPMLAFAALAAIALLVLASAGTGLQFLQKAAGYTPATNGISFAGAKDYLTNLQGGIAPLAIPACVIGLTVGGLALAGGQEWGRRTLTGVFVGATIVFLGPSILS
jgi:hypothetical protein